MSSEFSKSGAMEEEKVETKSQDQRKEEMDIKINCSIFCLVFQNEMMKNLRFRGGGLKNVNDRIVYNYNPLYNILETVCVCVYVLHI